MKHSDMLIIKASVFIFNILAILCVDVWLWTLSWCSGVGGLAGLVGFLIGYSISGGMTIAPRDYWILPDYEVFRKEASIRKYDMWIYDRGHNTNTLYH